MIPLGYEIGTGKAVEIPLNHMAILGQTQVSGKTTTMEAVALRSGVCAVAFITKPGEKSFRRQIAIPPFFTESTLEEYWKYVIAIVENLMEVKLAREERWWIVKLCRDYESRKTKTKPSYRWKKPKSLRDLLANIETALPLVTGRQEMICMQLQEYLWPTVKEIEGVEFSEKLDLCPGINVMDITDMSDSLKVLVIRSVIEWVHKRGRKIVVIIPEAWKFIPEGRNNPVKQALEGLIREGAGVGNFVWLDSQDLRGVDKKLLRSVIVWLFGVQRQKNEVASTLASIADYPKPTATQIMELDKGQFYVSYGRTLVRAYVQPEWLNEIHARAIATGDEPFESAAQVMREVDRGKRHPERSGDAEKETPETADVQQARDEGVPAGDPRGGDRAELHRSADEQNEEEGTGSVPGEKEEAMWKEKYETLREEHNELIQAHDALACQVLGLKSEIERLSGLPDGKGGKEEAKTAGRGAGSEKSGAHSPRPGQFNGEPDSPGFEALYEHIKARAAEDPGMVQLLVERPELRVAIQRPVLDLDTKTLRGRLAQLLSEGFFDEPRTGSAAFTELAERRKFRTAKPNVYRECDELARLGLLFSTSSGYQKVAGVKVKTQ